jgi:hypothetical protein
MRLVLCVTILAAAGCASWSAKRAVLRGNQEIYDGWRTRDDALLKRWIAPDVRYHLADGRVIGRDELIAGVHTIPGEIVSVSGMHVRVEQRGDSYTVCGVQRAVVRVEGKELIDDGAYCDDFVRRDSGWQVVEGYQTTR